MLQTILFSLDPVIFDKLLSPSRMMQCVLLYLIVSRRGEISVAYIVFAMMLVSATSTEIDRRYRSLFN